MDWLAVFVESELVKERPRIVRGLIEVADCDFVEDSHIEALLDFHGENVVFNGAGCDVFVETDDKIENLTLANQLLKQVEGTGQNYLNHKAQGDALARLHIHCQITHTLVVRNGAVGLYVEVLGPGNFIQNHGKLGDVGVYFEIVFVQRPHLDRLGLSRI